MVNCLRIAAVAASVASTVVAHMETEHDHAVIKREIQMREVLSAQAKRSLGACAGGVAKRDLDRRGVERRLATANRLRAERGISVEAPFLGRRDLAQMQEWEAKGASFRNFTGIDPAEIFATNGTSCILTPENIIGPYFIEHEIVRSDLVDGELGVPMHLEFEFVDSETCEPAQDLWIDVWAASTIGVYSGVNFTHDNTVITNNNGSRSLNYNRGVQPIDADGVAQFDAIFPGHYAGRATHQHVVAHYNSTILANGTRTGGVVKHIGQLFFDEALRSAVEATYPYTTNTQEVVANDDDFWAPLVTAADYDPFPNFAYLNPANISDGLLVWIQISINATADFATAVNAIEGWYTAEGAVDNDWCELNPGDALMCGTGSVPADTTAADLAAARLAAEVAANKTEVAE